MRSILFIKKVLKDLTSCWISELEGGGAWWGSVQGIVGSFPEGVGRAEESAEGMLPARDLLIKQRACLSNFL